MSELTSRAPHFANLARTTGPFFRLVPFEISRLRRIAFIERHLLRKGEIENGEQVNSCRTMDSTYENCCEYAIRL